MKNELLLQKGYVNSSTSLHIRKIITCLTCAGHPAFRGTGRETNKLNTNNKAISTPVLVSLHPISYLLHLDQMSLDQRKCCVVGQQSGQPSLRPHPQDCFLKQKKGGVGENTEKKHILEKNWSFYPILSSRLTPIFPPPVIEKKSNQVASCLETKHSFELQTCNFM